MDKSSLLNEYPLSVDEAAAYLLVSRQKLFVLCKEKKIAHLRLSYRHARFKKADLDRYLESCAVEVRP
jgi:excisionase family DNA binding protein